MSRQKLGSFRRIEIHSTDAVLVILFGFVLFILSTGAYYAHSDPNSSIYDPSLAPVLTLTDAILAVAGLLIVFAGFVGLLLDTGENYDERSERGES